MKCSFRAVRASFTKIVLFTKRIFPPNVIKARYEIRAVQNDGNNLIKTQILFIWFVLSLLPILRSIEAELFFPFDFAIELLSIYDKENVH